MKKSSTKECCRLAILFLLLFTALLLNGCQVAHMALPRELKSGSSELAVEGRTLSIFSESLQFGIYQISDIHRGWTKSQGFSIWGYSSSKAERKYEFSVNESDRTTWEVQCTTEADWSQLKKQGFLGGNLKITFSSNQQLVCTLKQAGDGEFSKLVMGQSANDRALKGMMTNSNTKIDISATHKLDSTSFQTREPTGYLFHSGGRSVGAVEVINTGTVWLSNSVTPEIRSALAATSTALLLYQDIQRTARR